MLKERMFIMKKFTSLLLALVMALSLAVPAFAVNKETDLGQGTKINSTINAATIKVTVSDTVTAVLNPYGIGFKANSTWLAAENYNQSQIASSDNLIISQSNIPLEVQVNVVGTPTSGVTLEANSTASKKTKSVYMWVQFGTVDTGLVGASDIETAVGATHAKVAPPKYAASPVFTASEGNPLDAIVIKSTALTKPVSVGTLEEVPYSGDPAAPQTISAIAYKLGGDMVIAPENNGAPNNWTNADKVEVNFTFTFIPKEAGVAAEIVETTALAVTANASAAVTWDAQAKINAASSVTTGVNTDLDKAAITISNAKIDNVDVTTAANVALDSDKKTVNISHALFVGNDAQFPHRTGDVHYLTFDVQYVDVNNWTIHKTVKIPINMTAASA